MREKAKKEAAELSNDIPTPQFDIPSMEKEKENDLQIIDEPVVDPKQLDF